MEHPRTHNKTWAQPRVVLYSRSKARFSHPHESWMAVE